MPSVKLLYVGTNPQNPLISVAPQLSFIVPSYVTVLSVHCSKLHYSPSVHCSKLCYNPVRPLFQATLQSCPFIVPSYVTVLSKVIDLLFCHKHDMFPTEAQNRCYPDWTSKWQRPHECMIVRVPRQHNATQDT